MRILALADRRDPTLSAGRLAEMSPDLVVACGDLPFAYLENVVTVANKPLLYVPGAADPELPAAPRIWQGWGAGSTQPVGVPDFEAVWEPGPGPQGCTNVDLKVLEAAGLRVAGLGGTLHAEPGPNRYPLAAMRRRARRLRRRVRRRRIDVLATHMPPAGGATAGSTILRDLVERLRPRLLIHGTASTGEWAIGDTRVVAATPSQVVEL